jgi:hypothetical protein
MPRLDFQHPVPRLLAALLTAGCGGAATGPTLASDIDYTLRIQPCLVPGCSQLGPDVTVLAPDTTIMVQVFIFDTTAGGPPTPITVRAYCATQFHVFRAGQLVDSVPRNPACADSTIAQSTAAFGTGIPWSIPADYTPGTYRFRNLSLVDPPISREIVLVIQ